MSIGTFECSTRPVELRPYNGLGELMAAWLGIIVMVWMFGLATLVWKAADRMEPIHLPCWALKAFVARGWVRRCSRCTGLGAITVVL